MNEQHQQLTNLLLSKKPWLGKLASELATIYIRISRVPVANRTQNDRQLCIWLKQAIA